MIELFHQPPARKPGQTRPVAILTLVAVMLLLPSEPSSNGQTVTVPAGGGTTTVEVFDWRWAFTQGGLTIVVLIGAWSWRRDFQRWADDRVTAAKEVAEAKARELTGVAEARAAAFEERIGFQQARVDEGIRYHRQLEAMIERTNETVTSNTVALAEHTTALARNTDSTHRLAHSVDKLDTRMERMEHNRT